MNANQFYFWVVYSLAISVFEPFNEIKHTDFQKAGLFVCILAILVIITLGFDGTVKRFIDNVLGIEGEETNRIRKGGIKK